MNVKIKFLKAYSEKKTTAQYFSHYIKYDNSFLYIGI